LLESAQILGRLRIFVSQRLDIADFDVGWLHAWPFGARAEKPAPNAFGDHARGMKGIAWNKKLYALTIAQIRTDNDTLSRPKVSSTICFSIWRPTLPNATGTARIHVAA
jgi:hypothetical protein